jgi:ribose transport system permease protein
MTEATGKGSEMTGQMAGRRKLDIGVGWGVILAFVLECVLLTILSPFFLSANNLFNVLKSFSFTGIIAVGMTMLIVVGALDLSVGSVMGLGGMVAAALMARVGVHPIPACLAGVLIGSLVGWVTSILVNKLKINSFIVTLAMLSVARGFTYMISRGSNIFIRSKGVMFLGQGYVSVVPFPVIIMLLLVILGAVFMSLTVVGRQIYAIGGNERAARLAGIRVHRVRSLVFIITSTLAAFAGIIASGMLGSAEMVAGTGLELDVIAAVIIGGASLSGGKGTIVGSLIGAAIMGVLRNGFILLGLPYEAQIISIGLVIILAVIIDSLRSGKR